MRWPSAMMTCGPPMAMFASRIDPMYLGSGVTSMSLSSQRVGPCADGHAWALLKGAGAGLLWPDRITDRPERILDLSFCLGRPSVNHRHFRRGPMALANAERGAGEAKSVVVVPVPRIVPVAVGTPHLVDSPRRHYRTAPAAPGALTCATPPASGPPRPSAGRRARTGRWRRTCSSWASRHCRRSVSSSMSACSSACARSVARHLARPDQLAGGRQRPCPAGGWPAESAAPWETSPRRASASHQIVELGEERRLAASSAHSTISRSMALRSR